MILVHSKRKKQT